MEQRRKPWFKWYPADWRADPRLRVCSLAARGLWIELIGFMHESPEYGRLLIGNKVPSAKQIASLVGADVATVKRCLEELDTNGVFSWDGDVIISRRMVRDNLKAEQDRINGGAGGNPLLSPKVNRGVNPSNNPQDKAARGHTSATQRLESISDANASGASAPLTDPVKEIFRRGLVILGGDTQAHRKLLGKLRQTYGDVVVLGAIVECENKMPSDPAGYLVACCQRRKNDGRSSGHAAALDVLARAAIDHDERQGYRSDFEAAH